MPSRPSAPAYDLSIVLLSQFSLDFQVRRSRPLLNIVTFISLPNSGAACEYFLSFITAPCDPLHRHCSTSL